MAAPTAPRVPAARYPHGDRRATALLSAGSSAIGASGTAVTPALGSSRAEVMAGGEIAAVTTGHGVPDGAWADAALGGLATAVVAIATAKAMGVSLTSDRLALLQSPRVVGKGLVGPDPLMLTPRMVPHVRGDPRTQASFAPSSGEGARGRSPVGCRCVFVVL